MIENKYKNKTVIEVLKDLKGQSIRIGAKNGSSFLFCGIVNDMTPYELMLEEAFQKRMRLCSINRKTPLLNRRIKDTYLSTDVTEVYPTYIILFEGTEVGYTWFAGDSKTQEHIEKRNKVLNIDTRYRIYKAFYKNYKKNKVI